MAWGDRRDQQNVPPNYFVVPARGGGASEQTPDHDMFAADRHTGRLELEIEVVDDGVHAGAGHWSSLGDGRLFREVSTFRGRSSIPGSGIKGAVRMIAEALTDSCAGDRNDTCRFHGPGSRTCFACRVFGALGFLGCVGFQEAVATDRDRSFGIMKLPLGYPPKNLKNQGRRFYGPPSAGLQNKVLYGVVPRGNRLRTALDFEQVGLTDLGVVFLAMGLDGSFLPRLGGAKFAGLGGVQFHPTALRLRRTADYASLDAVPSPDVATFVRETIDATVPGLSLSGRSALDRLREHMAPRGGSR